MKKNDNNGATPVKTVLVTGASGGMGRAAVQHFASLGYRVLALDIRTSEPSENVIPIVADVTNEDSVMAAFDAVRQHTDSLYAIVHYAGIYMLDSLVEMGFDSFKRIFDINLHGAFLINKTFMPLLSRDRKSVV